MGGSWQTLLAGCTRCRASEATCRPTREVAHLYQLLHEFQHFITELCCSLQLRHGAEAHEVALYLDGLITEPFSHI